MSLGKAVIKYTAVNGLDSEKEISFSPPNRTHHEPASNYIERVDNYVARVAGKVVKADTTSSIQWKTDLGYRNF